MPTPFTQLNPQDEFEQRALARFQGLPAPVPTLTPAPQFQDTTGSGEQPTGAMASLVQPAMPVPGAVPEPTDLTKAPPSPADAAAIAQGQEMANALTDDTPAKTLAKTELLPAVAGGPPLKTELLPAEAGGPPAKVELLNAGAQDPNYLTSKNLGDAAVEQFGLAAGDQAKAREIEQNLHGDTMHWDTETQKMEPGGNGELDEAEIAAHVADVTSSWKEGEAKIMADASAKLKANLEKLQANQEDLQLRYHQAIDDVATTYINPSELYDKGGFGAQIGMAGSAFLDTWFAMKGFNVPSFGAQWDRAIEQNIVAQKSKLEAKNAKVTGFAKMWDMAGQLATTEEARIAATKDLMKANLLGQYIAQMKPFDALQASRDKQALAAKAAREMGRTAQEWGERLAGEAQKAAQLEIQRAEYELKAAQVAAKNKALEQARGRGVNYGNTLKVASSGDKRALVDHLMKQDGVTFRPEDGAAASDAFAQLDNVRRDTVVDHLLQEGKGKTDWHIFYTLDAHGNRVAGGAYNLMALKEGAQKPELEKLNNLVSKARVLNELNAAYAAVIQEAKANGEDISSFSASGMAKQWWAKVMGDPGKPRTAAQMNLDRILRSESLIELHKLSGSAVVGSEADRFEMYFPTGAFAKDGSLRTGVSTGMANVAKQSAALVSELGQATGSIYKIGGGNGGLDALLSKVRDNDVRAEGVTLGSAVANANESPAAENDATQSLTGSSDYTNRNVIVGPGLELGSVIPAPKTAAEKSPLVMPASFKKAVENYFAGEPIDDKDQKALERHGETVKAVLEEQEKAHTGNLGDITRGTAQDIRDLASGVAGNDQQAALMAVAAQRLDTLGAEFDRLKNDGLKDTNPELYHVKLAKEIAEVKKSVDAALKFKVKTKAPPQTPEEIDAAYKAAVTKKNAKATADIGSADWFKAKD